MADYENNNQTNKPTAESGAENQNIQNQNNFTERQNQAAFGEGYANPQQAAYYANPQAGTYFNPRQAQPNSQGTPDGNAYYAQPGQQSAPEGNAYSAQQAAYYPPAGVYPVQPIEQKANVWYVLLSFFVPIAGLIIFLVERESRPKTAKASGICALVSYITRIIAYVLLCVVMLFATETFYNCFDDFFDDTDYYSYETDSNLVTDTISDYKCIVKSAEYAKDYQGNDAVVIAYEFTNNSEYPANFLSALYVKVYQNSSPIYETLPAEGAADITFNKTLAPGETAEIKAIYKLDSKDRDINVEIHNNEDQADGDYIDEYLTMSGAIN